MPVHLCWSWGCPGHSSPFRGARKVRSHLALPGELPFRPLGAQGCPQPPPPALLSLFLEPHVADSGPAGSRHSSRLRFWEQPWPVG